MEAVGHDGEHDGQTHEHDTHNFVLLFQIRHSPLAHSGGNFHHLGSAFTFLQHLPVEIPGKEQSKDRRGRNQPEECLFHVAKGFKGKELKLLCISTLKCEPNLATSPEKSKFMQATLIVYHVYCPMGCVQVSDKV